MGFADWVAARVVRALYPVLEDIGTQLRVIEQSNRRMERRMSEVQDVLDKLNAATNAVAEKQRADTALIEGLQQQLADALAANPQAQADLDAALAGMRATTATLEGLAATPGEP